MANLVRTEKQWLDLGRLTMLLGAMTLLNGGGIQALGLISGGAIMLPILQPSLWMRKFALMSGLFLDISCLATSIAHQIAAN